MRSGVQDFIYKPVTPEALRRCPRRASRRKVTPRKAEAADKSDRGDGIEGRRRHHHGRRESGRAAVHLSRKSASCCLDFARPLGNAHLLLDLHPRFGIRDAVENLDRLDSHFFSGLLTTHKTKLEILGGALQPEEWQTIPLGSWSAS